MGNPLKGEVDLKTASASYTLALGINEIIIVENLLDVSIVDIASWFGDRSRFRLGSIRAVLFAALSRHHDGISLEQAGEIIGEVGLDVAVDKLGQAIQAAFPEAKTPQNPQKRARPGTGKRS